MTEFTDAVSIQNSLGAGAALQWKQDWALTVQMDLTGSVIFTNHPVSFVGGNESICIDTSTSLNGGCDSAHQQIPAVGAWGSRY